MVQFCHRLFPPAVWENACSTLKEGRKKLGEKKVNDHRSIAWPFLLETASPGVPLVLHNKIVLFFNAKKCVIICSLVLWPEAEIYCCFGKTSAKNPASFT